LGTPGDVLVAISTSGASASVMRAVRTAQRLGMTVIGMTGLKGDRFAAECDVALVTPQAPTPRVQEGHIVRGHARCELIERGLFERPAGGPGSPARGRVAGMAASPSRPPRAGARSSAAGPRRSRRAPRTAVRARRP